MPGPKLTVGSDIPAKVRYDENLDKTNLLRLHYRIGRLSDRPGYVLQHYSDATAADRVQALRQVAQRDLDALFADLKAVGALSRRCVDDRQRWQETAIFGTPVEDPFAQLELEMMIDRDKKAVA